MEKQKSGEAEKHRSRKNKKTEKLGKAEKQKSREAGTAESRNQNKN
jgi:hypothetical protein